MQNWLLALIGQVFSVMTPDLRNALVAFIKTMEVNAKKTPNPWDDIFVGVLKSLLNIKDED
jgi:hypothetical protein